MIGGVKVGIVRINNGSYYLYYQGVLMMVVRLAHVCIETDDFGPTEEFYAHLGIHRQFEFRNKQEEPFFA